MIYQEMFFIIIMAMEFRHMFTADHHIFWHCIEPFLLIIYSDALTKSNEGREELGEGGGGRGGEVEWRIRSTDLEECLSMWSGEDC